MADYNRIEDLANATAFDVDGDKVGGVKDVYVNDTTGQPDFVSVNHGLFGGGDSIVPLRGHTLRDGELHLAFPKERIEDAPDLDENGHLTTEDQDAFYRHYSLTDVEDVTTTRPALASALRLQLAQQALAQQLATQQATATTLRLTATSSIPTAATSSTPTAQLSTTTSWFAPRSSSTSLPSASSPARSACASTS